MTILLEEVKDTKKIAPIWEEWMNEIGAEKEDAQCGDYWQGVINALGDRCKVIMCYKEDVPVGLIAGSIVPNFTGQLIGWIQHLFVHPDNREDEAIFRTLINNLQHFFTQNKCEYVMIELCSYLEKMDRIRDIILKKGYKHKVSLYQRGGNEIW